MQCANARLSGLVFLRSHCHIDMAYNALEYIFAALLDAPQVRPPTTSVCRTFSTMPPVQRVRSSAEAMATGIGVLFSSRIPGATRRLVVRHAVSPAIRTRRFPPEACGM